MQTLIIVDIQNDFLPGGNLAISKGDEIIPIIRELVEYPFDLIVATKDWHPANHGSFANNHGKQVGEHILLAGVDQVLWPAHCIQGTWGAEFAPGWDSTNIDTIIYKGTDAGIDSYSTFYDNGHRKSTGLEVYLQSKSAHELYIAGLATDYCVKFSVLDAIQLGFKPYVIVDACRGVNLEAHDTQLALDTMQKAGAVLLSIKDVANLIKQKRNVY